DTVARFLPYWHQTIAPAIQDGRRVIVAAHGNSLRALVKYLDGVSDADIVELNIPTGIPLVYELRDDLTPIRHFYLGDAAAAAAAGAGVAQRAAKKKKTKKKQGPGGLAAPGPSKNRRSRRTLFDRFRRFVGGDPQRAEEPSIVGCHLETA